MPDAACHMLCNCKYGGILILRFETRTLKDYLFALFKIDLSCRNPGVSIFSSCLYLDSILSFDYLISCITCSTNNRVDEFTFTGDRYKIVENFISNLIL